MNSSVTRAGTRTYVGVFMVTLVTLMYEILLTRIFSVTMYYHFAFMAISIATFGMTVGGIVVYLHPAYSRQDQALEQMGRSSFLFAVWIVIGILTHLFVPFYTGTSLKGLASMVVTFASLSAAFVYSGICVCGAHQVSTPSKPDLCRRSRRSGERVCVSHRCPQSYRRHERRFCCRASCRACLHAVFIPGPS